MWQGSELVLAFSFGGFCPAHAVAGHGKCAFYQARVTPQTNAGSRIHILLSAERGFQHFHLASRRENIKTFLSESKARAVVSEEPQTSVCQFRVGGESNRPFKRNFKRSILAGLRNHANAIGKKIRHAHNFEYLGLIIVDIDHDLGAGKESVTFFAIEIEAVDNPNSALAHLP